MKVFNICLTGISGSGKSTLANALKNELYQKGIKVQIVDGDDTRKEIGHLFGHTKQDRMKMNAINRLLVKYLNQNGISTILSIVAPFEEMRCLMRETFGDSYIEIYVKCSKEVCAQRDVKGYYKLEKEGELLNLNGVNDVYEIPQRPELILETDKDTLDVCVTKIMDYLAGNGYAV